MKNKTLEYKEYHGSMECDVENNILHGRILFINDIVTYEATEILTLKAEFEAAVEDYLETCTMIGKEPQKTYSGSFNVRVPRELHRGAVIESTKKDMTLNEFCKLAISEKIEAIKESERSKEPVLYINLVHPDKVLEKQYLDVTDTFSTTVQTVVGEEREERLAN